MKEKSQFTDKASDAKDKDERLSQDKCQPTAGSVYKPPKSTGFLESTGVSFWKDQKIWIQIAIVHLYVFRLNILSGFFKKPFHSTDSLFLSTFRDEKHIFDLTLKVNSLIPSNRF